MAIARERSSGFCLHLFSSDKSASLESVILPFYGPASFKIGRMSNKFSFKPVCHPLNKLGQLLHPVKDPLALRTPAVYRVPCAYVKVYVGQSSCTILEHLAEYNKLNQPEKPRLAKHCLRNKHPPLFDSTSILSKTESFWNRVVFETVSIRTEPLAVNRELGLNLTAC